MKKFIQILMVTCLVLSMTACGGSKVDDAVVVDENVVDEDIADDVAEDDASDVAEADTTESEVADAEADTADAADAEAEAVAEDAEEVKAYTPGTFTETGYETEFLGFRYITPEGFVISTPEELAELMGTTMDALTESGDITEIQKKYAELTTIYELMVSDSLGAANVNIILEKTDVPLNLYVDLIKEQLTGMSEMSVTITNEEEVEFAGADYTKVSSDVEMSGIAMKQEYYLRAVNGYVMCMTVTCAEGYEAAAETMMSGFTAF